MRRGVLTLFIALSVMPLAHAADAPTPTVSLQVDGTNRQPAAATASSTPDTGPQPSKPVAKFYRTMQQAADAGVNPVEAPQVSAPEYQGTSTVDLGGSGTPWLKYLGLTLLAAILGAMAYVWRSK